MSEKTEKDTILQQLTIKRNSTYENNPGMYSGNVTFQSSRGTLQIELDETVSQNLLAFLGPVLVKASAGLANQITNCFELSLSAVEKAKEIEAKSQPEPA